MSSCHPERKRGIRTWPTCSSLAALGMTFLAGCGDAPLNPSVATPPSPPPAERGRGHNVSLPTYEGSGETVHPDFVQAPAWWHQPGGRYLAITPYPDGNEGYENPSLFVGQFDKWKVPQNGANPVRYPPSGHLSDPDALFNPETREIWLYFRQVTDSSNVIKLMRSRDASTWGFDQPTVVVRGPNHTIVSPAVVRRAAGDWMMWAVNAQAGCSARKTSIELRRSSDGIKWSDAQAVDLPVPPSGLTPWHLEVQWMAALGEYWAVFNSKDSVNCGTRAIYMATSRDGVRWVTNPEPILVAGTVNFLKDIVYRTTFRYDAAADSVTFWYSGASVNKRNGFTWRTVVERVSRQALTARTSASLARATLEIPASAELLNPPVE